LNGRCGRFPEAPKEAAKPLGLPPGRFRPDDELLAFLEGL
jgi:hypothetical protein